MDIKIREFKKTEIEDMIRIWNDIVDDGVAFPQTEFLDAKSGMKFFKAQSFTGVAVDTSKNEEILGLYILHPNNVGRCAHIANASYVVAKHSRGLGIGEMLVCHSLQTALKIGFRIMQFNAVVEDNKMALRLYEKLGFTRLGVIKGGFLDKGGKFANIIPHYIDLNEFCTKKLQNN